MLMGDKETREMKKLIGIHLPLFQNYLSGICVYMEDSSTLLLPLSL